MKDLDHVDDVSNKRQRDVDSVLNGARNRRMETVVDKGEIVLRVVRDVSRVCCCAWICLRECVQKTCRAAPESRCSAGVPRFIVFVF